MDFPSSRYSLTDGLRKPVGITGDATSDCSLSSLWSGSGTTTGAPGERAFFALFERIFCCSSDPSGIDVHSWVQSFWSGKNVSKFLNGNRERINIYLTNKIEPHWKINDQREFAKCFTESMRRKNCIWIARGGTQAKLTGKWVNYHKFLEPENCERFFA